MMNGAETYRKVAEALPYEVQAALLAIRDDGLTLSKIPAGGIYAALHELMLITEWEDGVITLSRAGRHLVDYCTC